jgi:hypothetical protein
LLWDLLREYSEAYYRRTKQVAESIGDDWNPRTAPFEVDVYFVFVLSFMMLNHKHDRIVWQQVCEFCQEELIARYAAVLPECKDLGEVISARIQEYGRATNFCIENGTNYIAAWLDVLWQGLTSSGYRDGVLVIGDAFQHFEFIVQMEKVQIWVAGSFRCCLKHLLRECRDIRNMEIPVMLQHIREGQEDAKRILDA